MNGGGKFVSQRKDGKRSFKVVSAKQAGKKERGCKTKHHLNQKTEARYVSNDPMSAAKKAFTTLCNRKKIKGACGMFVTVEEVSRGSKGKQYTYECHKHLLKPPRKVTLANGTTITFKHEITAKALFSKKDKKTGHKSRQGEDGISAKAKNCKQSRGVMKKKSPKKSPKKKSAKKQKGGTVLYELLVNDPALKSLLDVASKEDKFEEWIGSNTVKQYWEDVEELLEDVIIGLDGLEVASVYNNDALKLSGLKLGPIDDRYKEPDEDGVCCVLKPGKYELVSRREDTFGDPDADDWRTSGTVVVYLVAETSDLLYQSYYKDNRNRLKKARAKAKNKKGVCFHKTKQVQFSL